MKAIAGIILLVIGFYIVGLTYQTYGAHSIIPLTNKLGIMISLIGGFILIVLKD